MLLFALNTLFIKNPEIADEPSPKISEEDEDKLINSRILIKSEDD